VAKTCAVKVITAPLLGLSGAVNREVVVDVNAHAGAAVTNARALNSTGTNRPREICRGFKRRLRATMGKCVMGFEAPISYVFIRRRDLKEANAG
jgi:hypothetical protein